MDAVTVRLFDAKEDGSMVDEYDNVAYYIIDYDSNLTLYTADDRVINMYSWTDWANVYPIEKEILNAL
jgi:hypothetical protein